MDESARFSVTHPQSSAAIDAARAYVEPFLHGVIPMDALTEARYSLVTAEDRNGASLVERIVPRLVGTHLFVNLPEGASSEAYEAAQRAVPRIFADGIRAYEIIVEPEERTLERFRPN